ncbi:hypothetical protein KP509_21G089600 [Ceratopteris richardii]|nr:hypothetical protein KP509_21G089600 [Ceratopteris richardii]
MAKMSSQKGVTYQYACTKTMGVIHKNRCVTGNAYKSKVYNKRKKVRARINASEGWETEETIAWNASEKTIKDAPPLSGIDLLLASALGLGDISWPEMKNDGTGLPDSCVDRDASLNTVDSSYQHNYAHREREEDALGSFSAMNQHHNAEHSMEGRKRIAVDPGTHLSNGSMGPGCTDRALILVDKHPGFLNVNESIRVLNLRKHLKNAGGLNRWLYSLGLEQFMDVFDKGTWGETDLLNLRMDELKRMGKAAVGPRRKLIWAIHHCSQQIV